MANFAWRNAVSNFNTPQEPDFSCKLFALVVFLVYLMVTTWPNILRYGLHGLENHVKHQQLLK